MKKLTPDEVRKLDRVVLESIFLQLQALQGATKARLLVIRQRVVLIETHIRRLKDCLLPHEKEGK